MFRLTISLGIALTDEARERFNVIQQEKLSCEQYNHSKQLYSGCDELPHYKKKKQKWNSIINKH
jgi:hypothetical protein